MREREVYHGLVVDPSKWIVIRVDGRGFTKFVDKHRFERPFSLSFNSAMVVTMNGLVSEFSSPFAYAQSDEISFVLPPGNDHFGRSVEKLVSIAAGVASASFTRAHGLLGVFDARVWVGDSLSDVVDYFSWRYSDCTRNAVSSALYWTLRGQGKTRREATKFLSGKSTAERKALLEELGIEIGVSWSPAFWYGDCHQNHVYHGPQTSEIMREEVRDALDSLRPDPPQLKADGVVEITFSERAFAVFGDEGSPLKQVRESSSAESPKAWVEDDHCDLDHMRALALESTNLNFAAFVAYVDTVPDPRWLDWEQPSKLVSSTGPPPWYDDQGKPIVEFIEHPFGWIVWYPVTGDPVHKLYATSADVALEHLHGRLGFEFPIVVNIHDDSLPRWEAEQVDFAHSTV